MSQPPKIQSRSIALILVAIGVVTTIGIIWMVRQGRASFEIALDRFEPDQVAAAVSSKDARDLRPLVKAIVRHPRSVPLEQIRVLDLAGCAELRSLRGIEKFPALEAVIAIGCPKLIRVEGIDEVRALRELVLTDCPDLADVEEISGLKVLETLDLSRAGQLATLELAGLSRLQHLILSGCGGLESLNLTGCGELRQLWLDGCRNLPEIAGLAELKQLTDLDASSCHQLAHLEGLTGLNKLEVLDLRNVLNLSNFQDVGSIGNLKVLRLGGQPGLIDLTLVAGLEALWELHVEGCADLESLAGFPASVSEYAGFTHCPKLASLDGIEKAAGLQRLDISGCQSVRDISLLEGLRELHDLNLAGCRSITDISVLEKLKQLAIVQLGGTGVPRADAAALQEKRPNLIVDFSGGAP